ncbi:hypothetical protein B7P43_G11540 [Cryptotermes secundus]|uniref:HAT C-terminal dimerisation domain-containing protein n=1 Tax=Cryptotermes secundus TaxID=105785 RepID=A0A2J7PEA8_9NEOP|nr:hypothetical protein B7P43_G11540 [Cryptotermes secundus]
MRTHSMVHHESLDRKELVPQPSEVMDTVVKTINYMKTRPLKSREEEILVHAEDEHSVSMLAYLSDIFQKFNTTQGNNTNVIVVTDKVKEFIGKLCVLVRKQQGKSLDIFSSSKYFVEENIVHSVNLHSRFSKYFPEVLSDKYKWITDPVHAVSPQNYDFYLEEEENYIDIYVYIHVSDISPEVQFPRKSYTEFLVDIGEEFLQLKRKALNYLLPFTTSYVCETGFLEVAAIRTQFHSIVNLEKSLRVAISKLYPPIIRHVQRGNHAHSPNPGMKHLFYF